MHGCPTVLGCEVDVMLVSCRQQLKYIIKEMHVAAPPQRLPLPPQPVRAAGGSQPCGSV